MTLAEELRKLAEEIDWVWHGEDGVSGDEIVKRLRLLAEKAEGKVLVKPIILPPIREGQFWVAIVADVTESGTTREEAIANLQKRLDEETKSETNKSGGAKE